MARYAVFTIRRQVADMLTASELHGATLSALLGELEAALEGSACERTSRALAGLRAAVVGGGGGAPQPGEAPAPGGAAPLEGYVVVAEVAGVAGLESVAGPEEAARVLESVRDGIRRMIPAAAIGRVGHGRIDFSLDATGEADVVERLTALQAGLRAAATGEGPNRQVRLGVSAAPPTLSKTKAVQQAETALVAAEGAGRACAVYSQEIRSGAAERMAVIRDLRIAMAAGELSVVYQPKLNLSTGAVDALEALVRWEHGSRGAVTPDIFIPLAEDSGDISTLTRLVFELVAKDAARLSGTRHKVALHVNFSATLLADAEFCSWALDVCTSSPLPLGLEITETGLISDPERALGRLRRFAEAGVDLAIDDYGAGLSSLSYLKLLPVNELKLDKQFIMGLTDSNRGPLIVRSTIDLAHALGMEITAEGVDDAVALALLRVMRCDRAQGYHVAKPMTFPALLAFLEDLPTHLTAGGSAPRLGPLRRRRRSAGVIPEAAPANAGLSRAG